MLLVLVVYPRSSSFFFFFNDTATTEIYTLSLHDALPISVEPRQEKIRAEKIRHRKLAVAEVRPVETAVGPVHEGFHAVKRDRKSTRLNSSHSQISYAVFCLKKKKIIKYTKNRLEQRTKVR